MLQELGSARTSDYRRKCVAPGRITIAVMVAIRDLLLSIRSCVDGALCGRHRVSLLVGGVGLLRGNRAIENVLISWIYSTLESRNILMFARPSLPRIISVQGPKFGLSIVLASINLAVDGLISW